MTLNIINFKMEKKEFKYLWSLKIYEVKEDFIEKKKLMKRYLLRGKFFIFFISCILVSYSVVN